MSFSDIVKRLKIPGESYTLQGQTQGTVRNEIGDFSTEWTDLCTLNGFIQSDSKYREGEKGQEEIPLYKGFFEVTFEILFNQLGDYRIKQVIPTTSPQTLFYQITSINRNLRRKNKLNHYQMNLELNPKW